MSTNFELTTENVRDYLMQGHYNLVGEIINDDEMTGFLCEVVRSVYKELHADCETGC